MAEQVTNYKCPACGGALRYDGALGKLKCEYCDSVYDVEQFEAQMQAQNEAAAAAMASGGDQWDMGESGSWGADGMRTYSCPSCGAELICDENTAATCCPYCGNQTVIPGQFSGSLKPEFVIPFKTDKEQAKTALKNHYKGKALLPRSFASGNHIEDIQGVYVPFWMFDCVAEGEMTYAATKSSRRDAGDREIITTRHYEVYRSGSLPFSKVPVDASTRMPDGHMDSIEPFDYSELKSFSMAYMPGFLADKYDVSAEDSSGRMEERCKRTFEDEVDKTVQGYDDVSGRHKDIRVHKGAAHYAMLPVWMLATKWNGKDFLFAMNGQSGKLVGDLPVDKGKFWGFLAGIAVVLVAIMQLLNNFVFSEPFTGIAMVGVCIIAPIVVALIVMLIMRATMKSARISRQAAMYITGGGLDLDRREDIFIRTTTETRMKRRSGDD